MNSSIRAAGFALLAFLGTALLAQAEPVRLVVQGRHTTEGQGWLFRDPQTGVCGVVTAAHVAIAGGQPVLIRSADKGDGVGVDVKVLSPPQADDPNGLDVAFMRVEGSILERGCTTDILRATDISYLLRRSPRGLVEQVTEAQQKTAQQVDFFESGGGNSGRLAVRPSRESDQINEGYSGSPITELPTDHQGAGSRALPMAMITQVIDERQASAISFDMIAALASRAIRGATSPGPRMHSATPAGGGAHALGATVVGWRGDTPDLGCPATHAIAQDGPCGWHARPLAGEHSIELVLDPKRPSISHVEVTVSPASETPVSVTVEVAARPGDDDWTWAKTVTTSTGLATLDFQPLVGQRVRLSLSAPSDRIVDVRVNSLN